MSTETAALQLRLRQLTGLDLTRTAVDTAVRKRMKDLHANDRIAYITQAMHKQDELTALIELVVVPESWFFRDVDAFNAARSFVVTRLREVRRPVNILSIPCAGGEEPYSMAMTLLDAGLSQNDVIIEGIDISLQAIERARQGIFQRNAFRTPDLSFRDRFFTSQADAFELAPEVRKMVRFRCGNLLNPDQELQSSRFDLIFCRNLLIYFDEPTQRAAIARLNDLLMNDGLLFAGYAEATTFCQYGFSMAPFPKAFALRKTNSVVQCAPLANPKPPKRRSPMRTAAAAVVENRPRLQISGASAPTARLDDLLRHGRELADRGALDDAERAYRQCLQIAPDCAEAYFMLGLLNEQRDNIAEAAEYLRRTVYLDPNHYDALCHLALLAGHEGDNNTSEQYRRRAARVYQRRSTEQNEP
ncbi:CheR family methyltransferase [Herbaspirillum sp. GCM10030257]|uniref:CheR family methyltransferase n=1 Tax=Herbaspirillum sp. GCM10030257 TaxID=3273393 RepID=UPI0036160C8F